MSPQSNSNNNPKESKTSTPQERNIETVEPWMLTAYVLRELSPEDTELVRRQLSQNTNLQEEIKEIERSVSKVTDALNGMQSDTLEEKRILTAVQRETLVSSSKGELNDTSHLLDLGVSNRHTKRPFYRRPVVVAALATAACVPALMMFSKNMYEIRSADRHVTGTPVTGTMVSGPIAQLERNLANGLTKENSPQLAPQPTPSYSPASSPAQSNFSLNQEVQQTFTSNNNSLGFVPASSAPVSGSVQGLATDTAHRIETTFQERRIPDVELPREIPDIGLVISRPDNKGKHFSGFSVPVSPGDRFDSIEENSFEDAEANPVTTFSIDVDTASYSFIRQRIQQQGILPEPSMVRIEEMINYFSYSYEQPKGDSPFAASLKISECPWAKGHQLVRVGIQARKIDTANRPRCNIVFLIDVSGSMSDANKLPLVQRSLSMLTQRLEEQDRIAIVVYAGASGVVLESTNGQDKEKIRKAIYSLQAGGSTNGGEGIRLAYKIAKENFIPEGANRVVLCTDGDFNVGVTSNEALVDLVKEQAKSNVFLTCLGFGRGNYNDAMMERISKDGNGLYGMIDNDREAKKLMVDQVMGTLVTVAKDVKLQMDFNPNLVKSYRLIGYENRALSNADFSNDKKDAGDIGSGHSVTALYEIIPTKMAGGTTSPAETESKYAKFKPDSTNSSTEVETIDPEMLKEWLTLRVRFKQPDAAESTLQEFVLEHDVAEPNETDLNDDQAWAVAVAEFGLLLRKSKYAPNADWERLLDRASAAIGPGNDEYRMECLELMRSAARLAKGNTYPTIDSSRD